jgi:phosphatidylglycerol:prolipoprotein diacylglycerol transferase
VISLLIPYPDIDPILFAIGPFAIRWYALAYIAGLILGWRYALRLAARPGSRVSPEQIDDFLMWATLGVVLGGRIGYVLFYKPLEYLSHPLEILAVWHGGMSFHGGMAGVALAILLFAWKRGVDWRDLADIAARCTPFGLFFGRIANFINSELWGRTASPDLPWAVIFPNGGPLPRHPSQLYEALLEGVVLFIVLWLVANRADAAKRPGFLTGTFLVGYGLARITAEFFREPDNFLGYLIGGATMGQLLSIPMVLAGIALMVLAKKRA